MTKEEYSAGQAILLGIAVRVIGIDMRGMLEWIDRSEALGPILDPTLYHAASERLEVFKELVQASFRFQRAAKKVVEVWSNDPVQP